MKTILLPIDFSDSTTKVLAVGREFAAAFKSKLVVLHIVEPEPDFVGYETGPVVVRTSVAEDVRHEKEKLETVKRELTEAGFEATILQIQGPTVEKVLEEARLQNADLIIVGSHGHGLFYNLLVGGVTPGLLKAAACPVLVVPAGPPPA